MPCYYYSWDPRATEPGGWDDYGAGYYDSNTFAPCDPSYVPPGNTRINVPNVTVTRGGTQINNTTLDKILNGALASLALLTGAKKIPTTLDPVTGQPVSQYAPGYNPALYQQQSGNTLGGVESWIKQNTGVTLLVAGGLALYFMKPGRR